MDKQTRVCLGSCPCVVVASHVKLKSSCEGVFVYSQRPDKVKRSSDIKIASLKIEEIKTEGGYK